MGTLRAVIGGNNACHCIHVAELITRVDKLEMAGRQQGLGQGKRGALSRIKGSGAARTMHSLQALQGLEQRQINRNRGALNGKVNKQPLFVNHPPIAEK